LSDSLRAFASSSALSRANRFHSFLLSRLRLPLMLFFAQKFSGGPNG
jgi:hypothetical protein